MLGCIICIIDNAPSFVTKFCSALSKEIRCFSIKAFAGKTISNMFIQTYLILPASRNKLKTLMRDLVNHCVQ